jgi:hypothetical protein
MEFPMTFFGLVETLFSIAAIIAGLFSVVKMQSLLLHLKKTNYERWRELTTLETPLGRFGPGTGNPSKLWKYVKSNVDNNIEQILRLKDSIKIGMRYLGIFVLASIAVFIIMALLTI